jgi:enoyl-CoA hydratase
MAEDVLVERVRPEVALVTLNRPASLNAMTPSLMRELYARLDEIAADRTIRVVVLTGAGRGFCSGHELSDITGDIGDGDSDAAAGGMRHQQLYADMILRLRAIPQAVIAAVNGPAAGGGLALALGADTRVCSESARFNAAFVRIGLSGCDVGVSYLLPKVVGPTLAFEMMLTGRLIDAAEAERAGLVLRVVPDGQVVDAALEIAEGILANSPFGVWMTKEVMWANLDAPNLQSALDLENRTQILCGFSPDSREAIMAFVEKRQPQFGRR